MNKVFLVHLHIHVYITLFKLFRSFSEMKIPLMKHKTK